jgi:hypothetical protein
MHYCYYCCCTVLCLLVCVFNKMQVRFVAFLATEYDEVLSGYQPSQTSTLRTRTEMVFETLEINAEKTKYMIMSRHPNSGQNQNIRIANESLENVAKFKFLGTTLTNQNDIHDEIKNRLNSGNACYYSVQNLLSSRLI